MKIISAFQDDICEVQCSCCGNDHVVKFSLPNKQIRDKDLYTTISFQHARKNFKNRLRSCLRLLKRRKYITKGTESYDNVMCTYEQIAELYSTLKSEYEQNDLLHQEDISLKKRDLELTSLSCKSYSEYFIFKSNDGFSFEMCLHKPEDKLLVQDVSFGYSISSFKYSIFELVNRCIKFVFDRDKDYIFKNYEISLSKEEFIDFMNSLNWFLNKIEQKSYSEDSIFTYMEVRDAADIGEYKC